MTCGQFSPTKDCNCDLPKGHEGMHHGVSQSQILSGLCYEQSWDEGFEQPPCFYMDRNGHIHATSLITEKEKQP